jgi:hypothetical protein
MDSLGALYHQAVQKRLVRRLDNLGSCGLRASSSYCLIDTVQTNNDRSEKVFVKPCSPYLLLPFFSSLTSIFRGESIYALLGSTVRALLSSSACDIRCAVCCYALRWTPRGNLPCANTQELRLFVLHRRPGSYRRRSYYSNYDAHYIFAEFDQAKLGITPMLFDPTFFCRACDSMASSKTCSHGVDKHVTLRGTHVRQTLQAGEL